SKKIYPDSLCNDCSLTCCINDLYLPVSYLEWQSIAYYLQKLSPDIIQRIKENLSKIPADLLKEPEPTQKTRYKYKNKSCPFLLDNKCSIAPYRPLACRTYGLTLKNRQNIVNSAKDLPQQLNSCSLELNRWRNIIKDQKNFEILLVPNPEFIATLQ